MGGTLRLLSPCLSLALLIQVRHSPDTSKDSPVGILCPGPVPHAVTDSKAGIKPGGRAPQGNKGTPDHIRRGVVALERIIEYTSFLSNIIR